MEKAFEIKRFGLDMIHKNLTKRHLQIPLRCGHPVRRTMGAFRLAYLAAPISGQVPAKYTRERSPTRLITNCLRQKPPDGHGV